MTLSSRKRCRSLISTQESFAAAVSVLPAELGLAVLDDRAVALTRGKLQPSVTCLGRRDDDLLLGQADAAELHGQPLQLARVAAAGIDRCTRNLGHAPEPVQDVPREADRLRELGVQVNRVEVARRACVAEGKVLVRCDLQLAHRTMFVQVPRTTSWPSWFFETDSKT